jgi:hypothetical protein
MDYRSLEIYFVWSVSEKLLKLLASLTRWAGVRAISCGISPMKKAAKQQMVSEDVQ